MKFNHPGLSLAILLSVGCGERTRLNLEGVAPESPPPGLTPDARPATVDASSRGPQAPDVGPDAAGGGGGSGGGGGILIGCMLPGRYRTNGGTIRELLLSPGGTYSADNGRFEGRYNWDGGTLEFVPSSGSMSSECAARYGSSCRLSFDVGCARILVKVLTDNCTGAGLLTQTSMLTRL